MFTKAQMKAINNFLLKDTKQVSKRQYLALPYIDPKTNRQYFSDGYRIMMINKPINDLTNTEYFDASYFFNMYKLADHKVVTLDINDIKTFYKNCDDKKRCLYMVDDTLFNCKYLIDLLTALPKAKLMLCTIGSIVKINHLLAVDDEATAIVLSCRKAA